MPKKRVFLSYSHKDSELKDEFLNHFAILKRSDEAELWHDRELLAGQTVDPEILERIHESDVFVFLISANFIHSEFCWGKEMHSAMELARTGMLATVGIVVRDADYDGAPFAGQLLLPKDAKAVTSQYWKNHDEAWTNVIKELRRVCRQFEKRDDPISKSASRGPGPSSQPSTSKIGLRDGGPPRIQVEVLQPE